MTSKLKAQAKLRFAAWALAAAAVVPAVIVACGPSRPGEESEEGTVEGVNPYRGFTGGNVNGETNFAALINAFPEAKAKGWAGPFWPYTANGIATSSLAGAGSGAGSPAGRYDAARGRRTNAQSWEVKMHGAGVKGVQGWWGHCNGWCAASALFPEPRKAVKVNGITFGVGDLKALMSEAGMAASADFFGNRVDPWTREYQKAYNDTVPGQYFLVLTNYMGKLKQPVLIDRYTSDQVWNQPLAGYRFDPPKKEDFKGCTTGEGGGTICKMNFSSTLWWYNDSGVPADVQTPEFAWKDEWVGGAQVIEHRDIRGELWLDGPVEFDAAGKVTQSGNIVVTRDGDYFVGGSWNMGDYADGHPDYMWVPYSMVKPDPNDDYANPEIDIEWIKAHLLTGDGVDDPSANPSPIESPPSPRPAPSDGPTPRPTSTTVTPPWPTFTPRPTSTSIPIPFPTSPGPRPTPRP